MDTVQSEQLISSIVTYLRGAMIHDKEGELNLCIGWIGTITQTSIEAYRERHESEIAYDIAKHKFGTKLREGSSKVSEAYIERVYVDDPDMIAVTRRLNHAKEVESACEYLREALKLRMQAVLAAVSMQRDEFRATNRKE